MKTIRIEGWRGINHSYAMVNQWQLLDLSQRNLRLLHVDIPFYNPQWSRTVNSCGLTSEQMAIIDSIPAPTGTEPIDICYRITYPYNLAHSNAEQIYVFGTSELQNTQGMFLNRDPKNANKRARNLFMMTPSNWSKIGFVKAGFDPDRVKVIPHGIDTSTFYPISEDSRQNWRVEMGIKDEQFVLLSLGAFTPNKGVDLLVVAYCILRKKFPHLRLVLKDQSNLYQIKGQSVVSNLERSPHRHHLDTEALADIVFISRNLNTAELRQIYGACDCYASPYRAEGFNLTPLEAAACGTPIVVTAGGSTDDYFHPVLGKQIEGALRTEGANTMIEPNLDSLITRLSELIEGQNSVGGQPASQYVHDHFAWSKVGDQLLKSMGVDA